MREENERLAPEEYLIWDGSGREQAPPVRTVSCQPRRSISSRLTAVKPQAFTLAKPWMTVCVSAISTLREPGVPDNQRPGLLSEARGLLRFCIQTSCWKCYREQGSHRTDPESDSAAKTIGLLPHHPFASIPRHLTQILRGLAFFPTVYLSGEKTEKKGRWREMKKWRVKQGRGVGQKEGWKMRLISEWLEYLGQKQILKQGPMQDKRLFSVLCTLDPRQSHFLQFRLYPHSHTHSRLILWSGGGMEWCKLFILQRMDEQQVLLYSTGK